MVFTARQVTILLQPQKEQEKKANKGKKRNTVAIGEKNAAKRIKKQDKADALALVVKFMS